MKNFNANLTANKQTDQDDCPENLHIWAFPTVEVNLSQML